MDWNEFKKDWLDPEGYKMLVNEIANIDWTQENLILASIFAVLISTIIAIYAVARRRPNAPWGWLVILTPILFIFFANLVEPQYNPIEFVGMVFLVIVAQGVIALKMMSMYAPTTKTYQP